MTGGSRGASFRVFNDKSGGSIRIISVRRIPTDSKREAEKDQQKPLEFHTKKIQEKLAKDNDKPVESGQESITIKMLPKAREKLDQDKSKLVKKIMPFGLGGSEKKDDDDATVPQPIVVGKKKDAPDDDNDADDTIKENVKEILQTAAKEEIIKTIKEGVGAGAGGGNRRRRLLGVGDDNDESGRIADSALESIAELFKQTKSLEKKQKLWKDVVTKLPEEQRKAFTKIVGGSPMATDPDDAESNKEPIIAPGDAAAKEPISKQKAEPAAKEDVNHVSNTEGCLVYGAIVTEKVPATIRFQAKSKWHNFVSHHLDMTHVVHDFTFGDLTHKLQEEFAHIKFHQFEGTKMMTSLAPKEYSSEEVKATHHHYMRVVGTHVSLLGMASAKETNLKAGGGGVDQLFQYTATSQQYHDTEHLPSAKFTFDFDPMLLTLREDAVPLHKFATSLMAIVGGVMVVFTMLNSLLGNMLLMVGKSS